MWIEKELVMLPTNEKATVGSIVTRPSDNRMATVNVLTINDPQPCVHQHLYILSDEEIKEGDWYFTGDYIEKCSCKEEANDLTEACKKIIATTDKLILKHMFDENSVRTVDFDVEVAKIPQSFINYFVEQYNKGNVIDKVLVEYEPKIVIDGHTIVGHELKINPDNTINIKPIKDSWSREEVKQLCWQAFIDFKCVDGKIKPSEAEKLLKPFNKWIEQNL